MRLPGLSGDGPKPAQVARDLYRDLADRRLLIVPVALLAMIVAVPLLLTSSPEPEPPPVQPDAEIAARAALETQAVVVRRPVGLRDYRHRLRGLTRSNPFRQQYRDVSTLEDAVEAIESEVGSEVNAGEVATSTGVADREPASAPTGTEAAAGAGNDERPARQTTETKFFEFVADVSMRLEGGRVALKRGVRALDLLPTDNTPLMVYLGSTSDLKVATFLVKPGARGELNGGQCLPSPERCEFVRLRPGGIARLSVPIESGEDARRVIFELRLDRLRSVEIDDAEKKQESSQRRSDPMRDAIEKRAGSSAPAVWRRVTGGRGLRAARPDAEEPSPARGDKGT